MKAIATILVILALAIAIVPQFTDCESQGKSIQLPSGKTIPMRCHWTSQAELATAGPMLVLGGLMFTNKRKEALRNLAILGIVLGVFVVLLPTYLIGVCDNNAMLCNNLMKPVLIFSGTLAAVASLVALGLSGRPEPKAKNEAEA